MPRGVPGGGVRALTTGMMKAAGSATGATEHFGLSGRGCVEFALLYPNISA